ncbi:Hep_Hag family structural protein [Rhodococcus phage E3]|uniref:Hep_Hag family structural protein n=1 Tax=Rhodococcus phage E3 TaxID=1007869 RepID=UPI0002C6BC97|nr:Hep_Hag family structural protein [Rhodococcus phage E3]AEQ21014.1 Hep_Hag family structural protein [Rhodococcus phage E3]
MAITYVYDPRARTITFTSLGTFVLAHLRSVRNRTQGRVLYLAGDPGAKVVGNVLTLPALYKATIDSSTDVLEISYDEQFWGGTPDPYDGRMADLVKRPGTALRAAVEELAGSSGGSSEELQALTAAVALKAPLASPAFTGSVTAPVIKLTTGAAAGRVLTSAADGTASWAAPASPSGLVINGEPVGTPPAGTSAGAGYGSIAMGHGAKVNVGTRSVVIGYEASASNGLTVAIGHQASASSNQTTALGDSAKAFHQYSTAIGVGATTTGENQLMLGRSSTTVVAPNKLQVGPDGPMAATFFTRTNGGGKLEVVAKSGTDEIIIATFP